MTEFTAYLRGNNFRPIEAKAAFAGLIEGDALILQREAGNQYDPNAIMVIQPESEIHLGYVAKEVAAELAPLMDDNREFRCTVEANMMKSVILKIEEVQVAEHALAGMTDDDDRFEPN